MKFYGIVNFGEDNNGEPFLGVFFDDLHFVTGAVTGDADDVYDWLIDPFVSTKEDYEKLWDVKIEHISWRDACQRKLDWLLEKLGGKEVVEYELHGGGELKFDIKPIIKQLKKEITNPRW